MTVESGGHHERFGSYLSSVNGIEQHIQQTQLSDKKAMHHVQHKSVLSNYGASPYGAHAESSFDNLGAGHNLINMEGLVNVRESYNKRHEAEGDLKCFEDDLIVTAFFTSRDRASQRSQDSGPQLDAIMAQQLQGETQQLIVMMKVASEKEKLANVRRLVRVDGLMGCRFKY